MNHSNIDMISFPCLWKISVWPIFKKLWFLLIYMSFNFTILYAPDDLEMIEGFCGCMMKDEFVPSNFFGKMLFVHL